MGTVFVYESVTLVDRVYSRTEHYVTDPAEGGPTFTHCSTAISNHTFRGWNMLDRSKRFSLNVGETPPGPYDDDNDDDDDGSN